MTDKRGASKNTPGQYGAEGSSKRDMRKNSPKRWVALALMVAMAMVLSFVEFPLFPSAQWLKYDPSSIIAILASLLYGPLLGSAVAVLAWVPRLITDPLGAFMNIMSVLPVIIVTGMLYQRSPSFGSAVRGSLVGGAVALVISVTLNYPVIPIFFGGQLEDVLEMTLPVLLPFNAIKVVLNCLVALFTYRKLEQLLDDGEAPAPAENGTKAAAQPTDHGKRTPAETGSAAPAQPTDRGKRTQAEGKR